jgi:putative FmdB family regulatory protein
MPTYEYLCTKCGNQWEEIQKISEAPIKVCPKCSKSTAKRQISGGSFILKGGGWYADSYSSPKPGKKDEASASSETKSADAGGSETKTKSTPAPKPEKSESSPPKAASAPSSGSSSGESK